MTIEQFIEKLQVVAKEQPGITVAVGDWSEEYTGPSVEMASRIMVCESYTHEGARNTDGLHDAKIPLLVIGVTKHMESAYIGRLTTIIKENKMVV